MPHRSEDPREQFEAVERLLTAWLKERRALLTHYTAVVVALDGEPSAASLHRRQVELCGMLVDYISAGHFEVFHELVEEAERFNDGSCNLAAELIPAISDTTEVILAYEEKYTGSDTTDDTLSRDVSALGEMLELRFELEDRLIAGLHNRHRRQMATARSA
ncbi:Rsd/AlgQ family anti-sigma factor [Parahaliea aestuarii]|uniref:Rsd/AlgQ family anti-sigma factor n=1 Tax=Parahaliea aestuarii TaxID=1852021 RepID=A0A5C8ZRT3_9GAMM|nr:Rsd/AlgQ family anti-sigma factor [Parahaliea aestuarii]TXS90514.1 Rsd/AlgQ family anti-sigma factor [Parahaliea aestuarii]